MGCLLPSALCAILFEPFIYGVLAEDGGARSCMQCCWMSHSVVKSLIVGYAFIPTCSRPSSSSENNVHFHVINNGIWGF